jgi:hypothetical protein
MTFSLTGPEFVAIAVSSAVVVLILVSKLVARCSPKRHDLQDLARRHAEFMRRKDREGEHRRY